MPTQCASPMGSLSAAPAVAQAATAVVFFSPPPWLLPWPECPCCGPSRLCCGSCPPYRGSFRGPNCHSCGHSRLRYGSCRPCRVPCSSCPDCSSSCPGRMRSVPDPSSSCSGLPCCGPGRHGAVLATHGAALAAHITVPTITSRSLPPMAHPQICALCIGLQ